MKRGTPFRDSDGMLWSHPSVHALMKLAGADEKPTDVIRRRCREMVTDAKAQGWSGPPFDPVILASINDIEVEAVDTGIKSDARIFPQEDGRLLIQYVSTVSPERQRFSISHELSHTRFPDCYEEVRYRHRRGKLDQRHQQLERLCNLGAAEILIPYDDVAPMIRNRRVSMQLADELRTAYASSIEAMLYRLVDLSDQACAVVFMSKRFKPREERATWEFDLGFEKPQAKFRIDYCRNSKRFTSYLPPHKSAPERSVVNKATDDVFPSAVEDWEIKGLGRVFVQAAVLPLIADDPSERVAALFTSTQ